LQELILTEAARSTLSLEQVRTGRGLVLTTTKKCIKLQQAILN
jgi:hypothetical protein